MKYLIYTLLLLFSVHSIALAQKATNDEKMFDEGYVLQSKDIKLANKVYSPGRDTTKPILYSIEKCKDETKVTFIQPIYFDSQWLSFSPGFVIMDRKTGDEYRVRGYADNLPFDKLLIVRGYNKRCIFVTLVFPKLGRKVKRVDILELSHEKSLLPSNDDGMPKSYFNINVEDYLVSNKKTPKVYK